MERWTPKQQRSRDKWRERGHLAQIQVENGWSREELAEYFKQVVEAKPEPVVATAAIVYNSADFVLNYLVPNRNKTKKK